MQLFEVTSWKRSQKTKFEKSLLVFAEGSTYRHDYIITFANELEMYKKLLGKIKDQYGKELNIQYHVARKVKEKAVKKSA